MTVKHVHKHKILAVLLATALLLVVLIGGVVAMFLFKSQPTPTYTPEAVVDRTQFTQQDEGKSEAVVQPTARAAYTVAPERPRILTIAKLGISARVVPMGLNDDRSIQAPVSIYDSGWYTDSALPGTTGAVFIDAHASGKTRQGLFAYVDTLKIDDTVTLEKGDGQVLTYRVKAVEIMPLDGIDIQKALNPYEGVQKGLNLMTCTGTWLPKDRTYDHRVVVYTEQVE